jgi:hypothetical protein
VRPHLQHTFRLTLRPDGTHLLRLVDVVRYWDLAATEKTEFNDGAIPLALRSVWAPKASETSVQPAASPRL